MYLFIFSQKLVSLLAKKQIFDPLGGECKIHSWKPPFNTPRSGEFFLSILKITHCATILKLAHCGRFCFASPETAQKTWSSRFDIKREAHKNRLSEELQIVYETS